MRLTYVLPGKSRDAATSGLIAAFPVPIVKSRYHEGGGGGKKRRNVNCGKCNVIRA